MRRFLAALMLAAGFVCTSCTPAADAPCPAASPTPPPRPAPTPPLAVHREQIFVPTADGGRIGGVLYRPQGLEEAPLVVCSHGLGAHYQSMTFWAEELAARGMAAFCFDFRGTDSPLSSGRATDMSVLTEVADILDLLAAAQSWSGVDGSRIVLLGESQGGFASAVAAGRRPAAVSGLMLLYPAFVIPDSIRLHFPDRNAIPEEYSDYMWVTLGRRYASDMYDYDAFSEIGGYEGPVLIIHGAEDTLVPVQYSQQAAQEYADAQLEIIGGAGHGLSTAEAHTALAFMIRYLEQTGILPQAES